MKPVERNKVQKLIQKIEDDNFNEIDIDALFIKLRPFSLNNPIFREIADLVAHNNIRDRGMTNRSIERMYLRYKYFLEYNLPLKSLKLTQPFPIWIKELFILQLDICNEQEIQRLFNIKKEGLKKQIQQNFKDDKKNGLTTCKVKKIKQVTIQAIEYIMKYITGKPIINHENISVELIQVLRHNKINFNEAQILKQSEKIIICTMLLFHHCEFTLKNKCIAFCKITTRKDIIDLNNTVIVNDEKRVEKFGELFITGELIVSSLNSEHKTQVTIMSSNLDAELWCDSNLVDSENSKKSLYLEENLNLNSSFQLSKP